MMISAELVVIGLDNNKRGIPMVAVVCDDDRARLVNWGRWKLVLTGSLIASATGQLTENVLHRIMMEGGGKGRYADTDRPHPTIDQADAEVIGQRVARLRLEDAKLAQVLEMFYTSSLPKCQLAMMCGVCRKTFSRRLAKAEGVVLFDVEGGV